MIRSLFLVAAILTTVSCLAWQRAAVPSDTPSSSPTDEAVLSEYKKFVGHWKLVDATRKEFLPQGVESALSEYRIVDGLLIKRYTGKGHFGCLLIALDISDPVESRRKIIMTENNLFRLKQTSRGLYVFEKADPAKGIPERMRIVFNEKGGYPESIDSPNTQVAIYERVPPAEVPDHFKIARADGQVVITLSADNRKATGYTGNTEEGIPLELDPNVSIQPAVEAYQQCGIVQHGPHQHVFSGRLRQWVTLTLPETGFPEPMQREGMLEITSPSKGRYTYDDSVGRWMMTDELKSLALSRLSAVLHPEANIAASEVTTTSSGETAKSKSETQPADHKPATNAPAAKSAIVIIVDPNSRQSEVVKQVVEALEKAGIARAESPDKVTPPKSAIHVTLSMRADESYEKIKHLIEALQAVGVEQLSFQAGGVQEPGKEVQNAIRLTAQPHYTTDELHRVEQAITASAKQSGLQFLLQTKIPGQENAPAYASDSQQLLQKELAKFVGKWQEASQKTFILEFKLQGDQLHYIENDEGRNEKGTIKLDLDATPHRIELNPGGNSAMPLLGLYTWDGLEAASNRPLRMRLTLDTGKYALSLDDKKASPMVFERMREASEDIPAASQVATPLPSTETKVLTVKGCSVSDIAQLLKHLNPDPPFQAIGNDKDFRLVVIGTPEQLASAEKTVNRLVELIAQVEKGHNKLDELLKTRGQEHPDVRMLYTELDALAAEISKLDAGLGRFSPPKHIEETEAAQDATSDFQLGVTLRRTNPTEAARILKLVISDDRFTAEPEGDNIVSVKYRSATKAEVELMASVLEQLEKPNAAQSTELGQGTTPLAKRESVAPSPEPLVNPPETGAPPAIGPQVVVLPLNRIQAAKAESLIKALYGKDRPRFVIDARGSQLLLTNASEAEVQYVEQILKVIDPPAASQQNETVQGQLIADRAKLAELKTKFGNRHPEVQSVEARISALEDLFRRGVGETEQSARPFGGGMSFGGGRGGSSAKPQSVPSDPGASSRERNQQLAEAVASALKQAGITGKDIQIEVRDGFCSLTGLWRNPDDHIRAEKLALSIPGITSVQHEPLVRKSPKPASDISSIKVFTLQHAQATEVAEVLKQVYDKGPAKIVPDARTNSVIVTGPEAQLQEIEALLLKLDEAGNSEAKINGKPDKANRNDARGYGYRQVRTYRVKVGDTLSGIALKELGRADWMPILLNLNRDHLKASDSLRVGMELTLPIPLSASELEAEAEADKLILHLQNELITLKSSLGVNHPKVIETQNRLNAARTLTRRSGQNPPAFEDTINHFVGTWSLIEWTPNNLDVLLPAQFQFERQGDGLSLTISDSRGPHTLTVLAGPQTGPLEKGELHLRGATKWPTDREEKGYYEFFRVGGSTNRTEYLRIKRYQNVGDGQPQKELHWVLSRQSPRPQCDETGTLEQRLQALGETLPNRTALETSVTDLRKQYEHADQQARTLADQLKAKPDEARQTELRAAVQRAFTARQSLVRAELMEMQSRLLQTQRSIEMRERISDQIIQRRVEDLLNPGMEWDSPTHAHDNAADASASQTKTRRIGVYSTDKLDSSALSGTPYKQGIWLKRVLEGPARRAGLQDGDILVSLNGLATAKTEDLHRILETTSGSLRFEVVRAGQVVRGELVPDEALREGPRRVLAALKDVQPGERLVEGQNVAFSSHSQSALAPFNGDFIQTHEELIDRAAVIPLHAGDVIRKTKLTEKGQYGASAAIPRGMRVFTFSANDTHTHAGLLRPGDRVDVTVTFADRKGNMVTKVLLECIEVFATENRTVHSEESQNEQRPRSVSLLVTPEQDGFVKIAQAKGQLALSLRHPDDDEVKNPNGINASIMEDLQRSIGEDELPRPSADDETRWRSAVVEIVVSGKSDVADNGARKVGFGIIVAADGTMISQMGGGWANHIRDWPNIDAQFDDGSIVPLQIVDEGGSGFVVLRPKQSVNLNHHFPLSGTKTTTGDKVNVGQMVATSPQKNLYGMSATAVTVTQTERRVATLSGLPVWQLTPPERIPNSFCYPVLNQDGELLAITLADTGGLLLAVPVEKLQEILPQSLGKLPTVPAVTQKTGPAAFMEKVQDILSENAGELPTVPANRTSAPQPAKGAEAPTDHKAAMLAKLQAKLAATAPISRSAEAIAERLKALQGTWTVDFYDAPDKDNVGGFQEIRISGDQLSTHRFNGEGNRLRVETMKIDLGDSSDERAVDLVGELPGRGPVKVFALYEITEDTLALTFRKDSPRPKEFGETAATCIRAQRKPVTMEPVPPPSPDQPAAGQP